MTNRKPVRDLTRNMRVTIHPEHKVGAIRCDPRHCIIANAIDDLPGVIDKRVGAQMVRIDYARHTLRGELDDNDRAIVRAWDLGDATFADGYTVTLHPPAKPLGSRRGEPHGTNVRSGHGNVVGPRRGSTRNLFVNPPSAHNDRDTRGAH